jgi:hypothetical protein
MNNSTACVLLLTQLSWRETCLYTIQSMHCICHSSFYVVEYVFTPSVYYITVIGMQIGESLLVHVPVCQ